MPPPARAKTNCWSSTLPTQPSTHPPMLGQPTPDSRRLRVRQAIQFAINKQELVDTLLYGDVEVGTTILPTGITLARCHPANSAWRTANALLDEAGWTMGADEHPGEGWQEDGVEDPPALGRSLREQTEQVLTEMLKAIGINLVIENVPSDVLFAG